MRFYEAAGDAVTHEREAAGLSMAALGALAGISSSTLQSIESGQTVLSLWYAAQIADALDITIDALAPVLIDERSAAE